MAKKMTILQFSAGLSRMGKGVRKALLPPMRKGISRLRKDVIRDIKGTSLGRALWVRKKKDRYGIPPLILEIEPRSRWSNTERAWVVGLKLKGMAVIQEEGGRTSPHVIRPKRSKFLAFESGGETIFARRVQHPGSKIRKRAIFVPKFEKRMPKIIEEVGDAYQALAEKSLR